MQGQLIQYISVDEAKQAFREVLMESGIVSNSPVVERPVFEVNTKKAKRIMMDKGYHVKSDSAWIDFVDNHGLDTVRVKKGREYWYPTEALDKIPARN